MSKIKILLISLLFAFVVYFWFLVLPKIVSDFSAFEWNNQNEQKVLDCNYFSAYKNVFVLRVPIGESAFSFGFIGLGNKNNEILTVKHEYGHYLQLKELGWYKYIRYIAIPSLKGSWGGVSYYDYYSQPWEYGAELYGEVNRVGYKYSSDVLEEYLKYINKIK